MTLNEARRLTGLTQIQLDELSGLTRGTVADIERGKNKNPSHETVTKIVRSLQRAGLVGVTAQDIFPVPDNSAADPDAGSSEAVAR